MLRYVFPVLMVLPVTAVAQDIPTLAPDAVDTPPQEVAGAKDSPETSEAVAIDPTKLSAQGSVGEVEDVVEPAVADVIDESATSTSPAVSLEKDQDGRETVVMLSDVLFPFGEARIRPEAEEALHQAAKEIGGYKGVVIEGHTDDIGSEAFNIALGQARAEAVRDWLISAGLDVGSFEIVSKGESEPKTPNRTAAQDDLPQNRALNRRVVFVLPPSK